MATYKPMKMNTGNGIVYTILRDFGGEWGSLQKPRYYKSLKSINRAIAKRKKLGI